MSRPSDYEFISANTDAIAAQVETVYTAITGQTVSPSSPQKLFIQWVTAVVAQAYANINIAANQNLPSRATGENLDALGELFYASTRPAAQAATVTVRFTISQALSSALIIPSGTRVSDGSIYFATTADATIAAGNTTIDVRCTCMTVGTDGNGIAIGDINTCVDVFPYYSAVTNIDESAGGTDEADDDEYYDLMTASQNAYSCAGARGAYEYWAKSVSTDIADVVVNSPSAGQVNIYALMNDGNAAGSEIKAAILAACNSEENRPLTDYVVTADPTASTFNIDFTYYIKSSETSSASAINTAVNAAVDDYVKWQTAKIGRDINPSKLTQLVMAAGAKRVVVRYPAFTSLNDGTNNQTPQLAKLGTRTVVNGGAEDE